MSTDDHPPHPTWFSRLTLPEKLGLVALAGQLVLVGVAVLLPKAIIGGALFGAASQLLGANHTIFGAIKSTLGLRP